MTKSAIIFGAGNVGWGFLGQLFSESGYEVVFVDVDEPLIAALDARRGYTIRLVNNDRAEEVTVSPVRALHATETEAVAQSLAEADLAATAVGVRALPHVAPLVAEGIVAAHGVEAAWLQAHAADLTRRFANRALGDTVFRLARDPLRKLGPTDRLVGAARLAEKAGVTPEALSWGIAAEGFGAVLSGVSGITPADPLAALVRESLDKLRAGRL